MRPACCRPPPARVGLAARRGPPPARSLKDDNGVGHRHDWRVDDMHAMVLQYFAAWSGKADAATVASTLLADNFVHIDEVWAGADVVAGAGGFTKFVAATRAAYPDLAITLDDYGPAGPHRLFARWSGAATNLGAYHGHKASRHSSALSGIDLFTFTPDRAAIAEVLVYRTPLAEDVAEVVERVAGGGGGAHELRLKRLVDKPRD